MVGRALAHASTGTAGLPLAVTIVSVGGANVRMHGIRF
jgi:hypothetical protein